MYFNDPTLYGATFPQREFPMPFYGATIPQREFPMPFYGTTLPQRELPMPFVPPFAQWQTMPFTNIPYQGYKGFVPQMFQQQIPPYFAQGYGFMPQYGYNLPFNWFKNVAY